MRDIKNNIKKEAVLDPVVWAGTATYTDIDLRGFDAASLLIHVGLDAGAGLDANNKIVGTLYDSPDGTTYTLVETADMVDLTVASGVVLTIDALDEDNVLYELGYIGGQPYLQLVLTETGTVSCPISIIVLKGHPMHMPVA